ncbi:FAD-binding oxidoreductase [Solwaraspora sp. WMMA2080]|uniref:FAD-binding oxidoreductase n=1 Tax=unclassified Solwaraspora TaxID=2627926 RepID=UPI00248B23A7|nr:MULTISPECIES: FAD-binding oxidoreductase [unclassified Solwaraspora]WBB95880.1 FAD-binding oxidoreductase [Solwaraspora sp. WMMA2059]WBC20216.1 FAD-binding oxidoreductase [Solwaraspora sp. WMMA2080]
MVSRRTALRAGAVAGLVPAVGLIGRPATAVPTPAEEPTRTPAEQPTQVRPQDPDIGPGAGRDDRPWRDLPDRQWVELQGQLSADATLYRPGGASYEALSIPYNHRYANVQPAAILTPGTPDDVAVAVSWAHDVGMPLVPRSSLGHNYAGYSTTTGLLMVMSRLRGIEVTPNRWPAPPRRYGSVEVTDDAGTITVQAGVVNADLLPILRDQGVFVPAGRCPTVGVAGLVLGGGIGFSDKMFGLTCDRLVSTEVVLADGTVTACDETNDPDLFWACRGGAGNNFGVNTSFTFRYVQLQGLVSFFRFRWSAASVTPAMLALQDVATAYRSDRRLDCRIGAGTTLAAGEQQVYADALGQFYGTVDELIEILEPVLRVGTPAEREANRDGVRAVSPAEASVLLSANTPAQQFAVKSAALPESLNRRQLQAVLDGLHRWPGSRNPDGAGIALFCLGGQVNEVQPDATAFVHRDVTFIMAAEATWADDDPPEVAVANELWLTEFFDEVFAGHPPAGAYQNFPDPHLADWRHAYYGGNYPRLVEVKRKYDPTGFFTYPQGIGSCGAVDGYANQWCPR